MRILAYSSWFLLALAVACNPGEEEDDGTTPPVGTGSSGSGTSGDATDDPATTEDPETTSEPTQTATGESTDDGPADTTTGDESGSTSAGSGDPGNWVLTVDNGSSPPRLVRADLAGGVAEICTLAGTVSYSSLVFDRDGTLYGNNVTAARIDTINPCNCSFQIVGPTSLGPISLGQGAADGDELLALDPSVDALVRVDKDTGLATVVGPLGYLFGGASLSWSEVLGAPYAVEGDNDYLYSIAPATGVATPLVPVTEDVTNPGFAVHPNDDGLYVCSGDTLYSLDPLTGLMLPIGPLGLTGACQTLAAPQTALDCIDSL